MGALVQLVAYGTQDVYLTGQPVITFFKNIYRRHTNFAIECIEHSFSGTPDFGRKCTANILRNGDLVTRMYLMCKLPEIRATLQTSDETVSALNSTMSKAIKEILKVAWVRRVGHALINSVELTIGGSKIDKHYGDWLNIWYELSEDNSHEVGYAKMIGDIKELTELQDAYATTSSTSTAVKPEYTLYIPLQFTFCRNTGLALPLIALQYHEVRVDFEFKNISELLVTNSYSTFNANNTLKIQNASLLVDYIFLDAEERRRFAQMSHEYLIEQLQFTGEESVTGLRTKHKLGFNHPTKELVWALKNGNFLGNKFLAYTHQNDWTGAVNEAAYNLVLGSLNISGTKDATLGRLSTQAAVTNTWIELTETDGGGTPVYQQNNTLAAELTTAGFTDLSITVSMDRAGDGSGTAVAVSEGPALMLNVKSLIKNNLSLLSKVSEIHITIKAAPESSNTKIVASITYISHKIELRDISSPLSAWTDTRTAYGKLLDTTVYQHHNYGILLDGSANPVSTALLQFNGNDRMDARAGGYFNYVQPYQHHTATPCDGINVYSFALKPEDHQPSGTANLSRIDSVQLTMSYLDSTKKSDDTYTIDVVNDNSKLYIFAFSYNVLRIMSGMGGLAYAS
jgi:hypothetical protein